MSPEQILALPMAQGYQLRSIGLMRQNVAMKPIGGGTLRDQAKEILGDDFQEWIDADG